MLLTHNGKALWPKSFFGRLNKKNPLLGGFFYICLHDREVAHQPHVKQLLEEQLEVLQLPPPIPAGEDVPDAEKIDINLKVRSEAHFGQGTNSSALFTSSSYL